MALTPTNLVRFRLSTLTSQGTERLLAMGPVGSGGTAAASTPVKLTSVAQAEDLFGDSQVVDAARIWFRSRLSAGRELWAFGFDQGTWTANTWTLTVASGTAPAGGTLNLRFGDFVIPVTVNRDDDQDAVAAAINTAINARTDVPATSTVLTNVVTVTSDYLGLEAQRIPVSVDLYSDRGERGVSGISVAVVNNTASAGEPGALVTTNLTEDYDWWLHANQGTAFLDSLEDFLETGWQERNNYAHAFKAIYGTSQSAVTAVTSSRNDPHHTYVAQKDTPSFELSMAMRTVIELLSKLDLPQGAGGFQSQQVRLPGNPPTEPNFDSEALLQAGQVPLRVARNGRAVFVRLVGNRRENDQAVEDLRLFGLDAILRTRELGQRMVVENAKSLDKGIIDSGQVPAAAVAPFVVSKEQIRLGYVALFTQAGADGLITTADPDTPFDPAAVVTDITLRTQGGTVVGFDIVVNPEIVQNVVELETLATLA